MQRRRTQSYVAEAHEVSDLQSFIVFDGRLPKDELSEPTILFQRLPESHPPHFGVNQAGLLLTFLRFSTKFANDAPCDYIATSTHEFAVMELSCNVWMSVQRQIATSPNRNLLHSILRSCKSIYELFFPPPERDEKGDVTKASRLIIEQVFSMIVRAISWTDLAFVHLFDSFFQLKLGEVFQAELCPIIQRVLDSRCGIAHIAIMYSRYFVFYTFPTDTAKTLAICLRIKFPYLFPKVLAKEEERMYWIIGMSRSNHTGGISIYAPTLCIEGQNYPLIALRKRKLRIILALKPDTVPSPSLLMEIPPILTELQEKFKNFHIEAAQGKKPGPYVVLKNHKQEKSLQLSNEKLSDTSIHIAENSIFLGQWFASNVASTASVAFPGPLDYSIYFRASVAEDTAVMCKDQCKDISKRIEKCKELEEPENVKRICVRV